MRFPLHALLLPPLCALALCRPAAAAPPTAAPAPLAERLRAMVERMDADPLELARAVRGCDPEAVQTALETAEVPVVTRLAAVRAAPWLARPERTLLPLVTIMGGRDSLLAPAAANAIRRIVAGVDGRALSSAEVVLGDLAGLRSALELMIGRDHLRPDFVAVAVEAFAWIDALTPGGTRPKPLRNDDEG